MKEFNKEIVPLPVVGTFFNYAGNYLLHDIQTKLSDKPVDQRQVFYPLHEVVGITLLKNGYHLVTCRRVGHKDKFLMFKAKSVIMGNGAQQILHPEFKRKWFSNYKGKILLSNDFLQRKVFKQTMEEITKMTKQPKVVIIGASHSGFSCAWLLLNGPASFKTHNFMKLEKWAKFPEAHRYENSKCEVCKDLYEKCLCLGAEFEYDEFEFDYGSLPQWEDGQV